MNTNENIRVLYLTDNPNLGSTTRTLQSWLLIGKENNMEGYLVIQKKGDFSNWLDMHKIPYHIDPMPWPNRWWPFQSFWHALKVAYWAKRWKIKIIHCNEHNTYLFGLMVKRLLSCPIVCQVKYHVARAFCQWVFGGSRQPDILLWTSQNQWKDCMEAIDGIFPYNCQQLVYEGLDLNRFGNLVNCRSQIRERWGAQSNTIVIGSASALRPRKRIEDFIELINKLAKQYPHIVGMIAGDVMPGDEEYKKIMLDKIQASGLGKRLQWLGNLEPIEPFMHAIDIFISTSEYETFGMSVCEAMACGKPVVAYKGGSVQEVVGDTGIIVETGDLPALIEGVKKLIENSELRLELGNKARQRVVEHFDPAKSFQQLKQIYDSLIAHSTPRFITFI